MRRIRHIERAAAQDDIALRAMDAIPIPQNHPVRDRYHATAGRLRESSRVAGAVTDIHCA